MLDVSDLQILFYITLHRHSPGRRGTQVDWFKHGLFKHTAVSFTNKILIGQRKMRSPRLRLMRYLRTERRVGLHVLCMFSVNESQLASLVKTNLIYLLYIIDNEQSF